MIGMNASACAASYELKDHSFHAAEVLASVWEECHFDILPRLVVYCLLYMRIVEEVPTTPNETKPVYRLSPSLESMHGARIRKPNSCETSQLVWLEIFALMT